MAIIKDGSGTGNTLRINEENRADVESVSRSITQHINEKYEKHFSLSFENIDPVGADDYFFYYKNTGLKNIHLTKFRFLSTVAGSVEIHSVTGTPSYVSESAVVPVNRSFGSSAAVTATINTDTNITGLTSAGMAIKLRLDTINKDYVDDAPSHIILPPGQALALLWDAATGAITSTIDIYEDQGVT